jgi:PhnB protein
MSRIRMVLPAHLRNLARAGSEVELDVEGAPTLRAALDALEAAYPMLRGTIRDHVTQQRRPFLRFFACSEDISHESPDQPLPESVVAGKEPLLIIGAIAGGSDAVPKTSIAPMLNVRNGARAVEFYKQAFGAGELFRIDDESSGAVVARLSVEGAEFWVADESPEHQNFSPATVGGGTVRMVMIVADPDAAFARAITAGATEVWPVANQYGWRLGRVVDPFGHHWEIGKPL